jgi:putative DNA primase/helicase
MKLENVDIKNEVIALAEAVKPVEFRIFSGLPVLTRLDDIAIQTVTWLWTGLIALGKFSLLIGNAGVGKTFLLCDIISRLTRGDTFPGDAVGATPASVILVAPEDGEADTLKPRLVASGADESRVLLLSRVQVRNKSGACAEQAFNLQNGLSALDSALEQHPEVRLIVIDPITAVLGDTDANNVIEVRAVLQPLITMAEKRDVAIFGTTHLSKAGDKTAMHRALGSGAFIALARMVVLVAPDRNNEKRRYLLSVKNNLAKKPPGHAYCLEPSEVLDVPYVVWEAGTIDLDADQALSDSESLEKDANRSTAIRDSLEILLEDGVWHPKDSVVEALRKGMPGKISEAMISRAADSLGVEFQKKGFPAKSLWRLANADAAKKF